MAITGDSHMATSGDFFMATDISTSSSFCPLPAAARPAACFLWPHPPTLNGEGVEEVRCREAELAVSGCV